MQDLTVVAIPGFFATMGIEHRVLKQRAARQGPSAGDYERRDTLASLAMGVGSLVIPLAHGPDPPARHARSGPLRPGPSSGWASGPPRSRRRPTSWCAGPSMTSNGASAHRRRRRPPSCAGPAGSGPRPPWPPCRPVSSPPRPVGRRAPRAGASTTATAPSRDLGTGVLATLGRRSSPGTPSTTGTTVSSTRAGGCGPSTSCTTRASATTCPPRCASRWPRTSARSCRTACSAPSGCARR